MTSSSVASSETVPGEAGRVETSWRSEEGSDERRRRGRGRSAGAVVLEEVMSALGGGGKNGGAVLGSGARGGEPSRSGWSAWRVWISLRVRDDCGERAVNWTDFVGGESVSDSSPAGSAGGGGPRE